MANIVNTYWLKKGLGGDQSEGVITQNESVIILFDQVVDNSIDAIRDSLFVEGQAHRLKPFEFFLNDGIQADVVEDDTGLSWQFELTYTTRPIGGSSTTDDDEFYIPEVDFGRWTYQIVVDRDKVTGDPLVNPAGDPVDPLPVDTVSAITISITVKENSPNLGRIQDIGSINSSTVKIAGVSIPKYCGMFDDYRTQPFRENEFVISFKNTLTFKLKYFKNKAGDRIGFKLETLNSGFNYIDEEGERAEIKIQTAKDPDDLSKGYDWVPVATPQLLTEDGFLTETASYTEYVVNDVINFSQFGLPTSYPVS